MFNPNLETQRLSKGTMTIVMHTENTQIYFNDSLPGTLKEIISCQERSNNFL